MQISKRDRNLLILLAFVLVGALFYFLAFVPTEEKLKSLIGEVETETAIQNEIKDKLLLEKPLVDRILFLESEISGLSEGYYRQLDQEEALMLVRSISSPLEVGFEQLAFSTKATEAYQMDTHLAEVTYKGDYHDLMGFLRGVRQHSKNLYVRELSLSRNASNDVEGRFLLEFDILSGMRAFSPETLHWVDAQENTRDITQSPFVPYADFKPYEEETAVVLPVYPEIDETVDYESYRPKTQIYGFEDGGAFFVSNVPEIEGTLTRSKTKVAGGYSAALSFDYKVPRTYSEANIVFEHNAVTLNKQPEYIGLWTYAYEASNHNIGVALLDSAGKEYKIELTKGVDFTQWKELEVLLPLEITYPCKITRIYVEGVGYGQKLNGKYLFDQLQVSYPVD